MFATGRVSAIFSDALGVHANPLGSDSMPE